MAETLDMISILSFILAVVFGVLTVVIWFFFKIPNVAGDLSGRNARKSIEKMRSNNEKNIPKLSEVSEKNIERIKQTSSIQNKNKITEKIENQEISAEEKSGTKQKRNLKNGLVVDENNTEMLIKNNATEMLIEDNSTVQLKNPMDNVEIMKPKVIISLKNEIIFVHTEEVI